jgi:hypothetical protein
MPTGDVDALMRALDPSGEEAKPAKEAEVLVALWHPGMALWCEHAAAMTAAAADDPIEK